MFTNLFISIYINSDVCQEESHEFQTAHLLRLSLIAKHNPRGHKPEQPSTGPQTIIVKVPQTRRGSLQWLQGHGSEGRAFAQVLCWYDHQQ